MNEDNKEEFEETKALNEISEEKQEITQEELVQEEVKLENIPDEKQLSEESKSEEPKKEVAVESKSDYSEGNGKRAKKNNKNLIIVMIIIAFVILFSTIFAVLNMANMNILSGITIKGIDVSGLSKAEAIEKLSKIVDEKLTKEINVKYEEYESTINPSLMEASFDIESAVNEAYSYGRSGNLIENNYNILAALLFKKDIAMDVEVDDELAIKAIDDVGSKIPGHVKQYSYYIEGETLIITRGTAGLKVLTAEMYQLVYNNLNDFNASKDYIMIPTENIQPNDIDIDAIYNEVHKEPQDAYYVEEPFEIFAEVDGVSFDLEAARAKISQEYKDEYSFKLQITKAEFTTDDVGLEAFPDVLATFTTKYDASNKNRSTNLELATNKINGVVLMPGEEFSYNKIVGERTIEAGYKEAKIYSNGKVIDGLGGGICQVSSTLYNSVLESNLEITERHNHQFVTSYVAAGRDATVVWGVKDFKFKNNRTYPIKIEASVKNGICKISIYGVKEEIEYTVSIKVEQISVRPYSTKYEEDDTLELGVEEIKQNGTNGRVTATYKELYGPNGLVSRTLISKDTYNAMQKIVIKGTKGAKTLVEVNN